MRLCERCAVGNVRRVLQHNLFASSSFTAPRQVVGLDFKMIRVGDEVAQLLLMVDRFSGFATMAVLPERTAAATIAALDMEFFSIFGAPRKITVDGAPEFRSAKLRRWIESRGCELVPPMEFYPNAAGATERVWVMVRTTLRRTELFDAWRAELRQAVYQYNALSRDGRPSPFLLFLGGEPNTAAGAAASEQRPPLPPDTDAHSVILEGAEAVRGLAAADGDLVRRARAVSLNKKGRTPKTFHVGQPVWFWQDISGGVNRGDDRPRSCLTPWQAGTVRQVHGGVRYSIAPLATGRGRRQLYERHPTRMKPRPTRQTEQEPIPLATGTTTWYTQAFSSGEPNLPPPPSTLHTANERLAANAQPVHTANERFAANAQPRHTANERFGHAANERLADNVQPVHPANERSAATVQLVLAATERPVTNVQPRHVVNMRRDVQHILAAPVTEAVPRHNPRKRGWSRR